LLGDNGSMNSGALQHGPTHSAAAAFFIVDANTPSIVAHASLTLWRTRRPQTFLERSQECGANRLVMPAFNVVAGMTTG
jgi:metallophosphoesterase superfamily enzyme